MPQRILIAEDDRSICDMIGDYLNSEDFSTDICYTGSDAIKSFFNGCNYELVLIDLMLPDMSGIEVIRTIRKTSTVPVIIITAKDNDTDKSLGLNSGADDYVVKPFSLIELTARIKANIRRATSYDNPLTKGIIQINGLLIDPGAYSVRISGTDLGLTRTEFEILYLLASHPGQSFSKERLYGLVWKEPYFGNENVLNTHMNRLRAKLKNASGKDTVYIKTLWGIGYKMEENK